MISLDLDPFISHYKTELWGNSVLLMEKNGNAFGRIYWYSDDSSIVYLDMLSVNINERKLGLGTKLQEIREEIGRSLGATFSCLWVYKNTWMYDWYKRRGYIDWTERSDKDNSIWMRKTLS